MNTEYYDILSKIEKQTWEVIEVLIEQPEPNYSQIRSLAEGWAEVYNLKKDIEKIMQYKKGGNFIESTI